MKKAIITSLAAITLVTGAYGQGSILLDNGAANNGITKDSPGNWYSGTYGMEVWVRNGTNFNLNSINHYAGVDGGITAYSLLASGGFSLVATYTNQYIAPINAGIFQLGRLDIPIVNPAGSTITVALAAWIGSGPTYASNIGTYSGTFGTYTYSIGNGVVAFYTATTDYTQFPTPNPARITAGWNAAGVDLIMAPLIPEPRTLTMMIAASCTFALKRRRRACSASLRA